MGSSGKIYDVIVVGAGHAGCEAALAAARMGCDVLLMMIDLDKVAAMPCSPSIGGTAKGQIVREIDALGGEMARISDRSAIQYKTLNTSKGPAVHATRTQNDKNLYHKAMKAVLEHQDRLDLRQALVESLIVEDGRIRGVVDFTGFVYPGRCVVLTTGTFLSGLVHIGTMQLKAGRTGEFAAYGLAENLRNLGFDLGRMKTGTPPRLHRRSIDFSRFVEHSADETPRPFSFSSRAASTIRMPSYIGHTNARSRKIIIDNLHQSPLYCGTIKGVSARYCPSFEDKAVKFPQRESHHVILEPEGIESEEIYASGLGNSMPIDVQLDFVHSVEGLEEAEIIRPAYAIEYDFVNPLQLQPTLETKRVKGLYMAGQINGTSGYEEAAGQGIWAGINAALSVQGRPPFLLDRSQAYIAVMVDDLVTRGTVEPYRMFTSRAEYRLVMREDNADLRLREIGHGLGLVDEDTVREVRDRKKQIEGEISRIRSAVVKPRDEVNTYLASRGSNTISNGVHLDQLLKRAELDYDVVDALAKAPDPPAPDVARQVEIEIKYEGYIDRQRAEINKFRSLERIRIPDDFDYGAAHGLSNEIREKLSRIRPLSLGQASRIDGITPAAISVLMVSLRKGEARNRSEP
ncbi:tRNA uridine-5-carboxymethylaminomethyl(34) synthesis enzyme MnmG [Desulfatiferula olefinivorans]